jgi:AraC family transcriptional regulator of adaptative response/methylated-DNA-[protein]-cysteine methyltransferase
VRRRFGAGLVPAEHAYLKQVRQELVAYFAGTLTAFTVPLVAPGTPFEERVWAELLKIPYAETRSYEDVAVALNNRAAVRAVGRANGLNRIAIVIPCHRVVNKSGELGGYGGGLWRKRRLLRMEDSATLAQSPSDGMIDVGDGGFAIFVIVLARWRKRSRPERISNPLACWAWRDDFPQGRRPASVAAIRLSEFFVTAVIGAVLYRNSLNGDAPQSGSQNQPCPPRWRTSSGPDSIARHRLRAGDALWRRRRVHRRGRHHLALNTWEALRSPPRRAPRASTIWRSCIPLARYWPMRFGVCRRQAFHWMAHPITASVKHCIFAIPTRTASSCIGTGPVTRGLSMPPAS